MGASEGSAGGAAVGCGLGLDAGAGAAEGATTHWEDAILPGEALPVQPEAHTPYRRSGRLVTSAGMAAAAEVTLAVLGRLVPRPLAARTARSLVLERIRPGGTLQPRSLGEMPGHADRTLRTALTLMEAHIEEPLPARVLTREAGVCICQLERFFRRHLDSSPTRFYREIRARRARALIEGSDLDPAEIALACGFGSAGQLAMVFRSQFFRPPSCFRGPLFADPGGLDAQAVPTPA